MIERERAWAELDQPWDLIIIGGGITGAGILREAVKLGLRAALFEAKDFAAGTSSRSSKLVHGGFRYLQNGQIKLTYQSVRERERLLKDGRGLVTPLGCLLANYTGDRFPAWIFGAGLSLYDLLALHWGHRHYDSYDMQSLCPGLCGSGLRGGYRFFDAQTDDARLVLRLIQEAIQAGGLALNYAPVIGLLRRGFGRASTNQAVSEQGQPVCGVAVRDDSPLGNGRMREVNAPLVINACGVWADEIRQFVGVPQRLRRLRGSHLILPAKRLPLTRSINVFHPRDGRPVFAYQWEGVTLVGTTDVDHQVPLQVDPRISQEEIAYLLEFLNKAFPEQTLDSSDIQATFSGIRAVVNTGKADPSKESREHVLWNEDGLLTITGGKLTTFRLMAKAAINRVRQQLPERKWESGTNQQHILDPLTMVTLNQTEFPPGLAPAMRLRLLGRYGNRTASMLQNTPGSELESIGGSLYTWAELRWACREAVIHLEDILMRRVRLGLVLPQGGIPLLGQIRGIVQPELGWDDQTWQEETNQYIQLWQTAYSIN